MNLTKNSDFTEILDRKKIVSDLDRSTDLIADEVSGLSFDKFNFKNEKGAWSVGDCIEHLVMIEESAKNILLGPVKFYNREFDQKLSVIKNAFADRNKKFTAAREISPTAELKDPEKIIAAFKANREEIKKIIETADLTVLCDAYRHPLFGHFTRIEWIYYVIYHSERHFRQIGRIMSSLPQ